jgi:pimeloyl-ACP methyl ester carboxylesterase
MILVRKIFWMIAFAVAGVFLLLVGLGFQGDAPGSIPPGVAGRQVVVDQIKLRIVESGNGPRAVILLHGMIGSAEDWETVVPLLEPRYRVIAVDRPGHGYSDTPHETNNVAFNARMVRGLISALDLKDVVVVGHSYGGSVALQLAAEPPAVLRGVVLVAPGAYPDFPPGVLERLIAAPIVGRGITRLLIPLIGESEIRAQLAAAVAPDGNALPKTFFDQRVLLWKKPAPLRAYAEHSLSFNADLESLSRQYAKITRPVVILQGAADAAPGIGKRSAQLAQEITGAQLQSFPATGHYLQYRHSQAVVEAVDQVYGVHSRNQRHPRR